MKTRLDAELVRRELARSREHAADLIESRSVLVSGIPATKPASQVDALTGDQISEDIDLVVADLSFISLSLVLPALAAVSRPDADFVLMVKPQFEVGREKLGAGGVVRDPALRRAAVLDVAESAYDVGLGTLGIAASPLPGPAGNVEYFLWLRRGAPEINEQALDEAIAAGPE